MEMKTTAASYTEDLDRAQRLGLEAAYSETIRGRALDDDSAGFPYPSFSPRRAPGVFVHVNSDSPTQALATNEIEHLADRLGQGGMKAGVPFHFVIKSSLADENEETRPTRDPESSLADLIDRFRHHPKIRFAKRIAARLDYLLEVSREEQPEQAPPAVTSLAGFLAFLSKNPGLAYPDIVLTPDGNVRAQWRRGPRQHFAVEFREDEDVRFVIFAPDPKHPYKTARVSGSATVDSVMGQAQYYQVLDWAKAENDPAA
jgi:hypothetical protein